MHSRLRRARQSSHDGDDARHRSRAPSDENLHEREERDERDEREDVRAVSSRVFTAARVPTGVARPGRVQPARGALRERFPDRRSRRAHRVLVRRRLRGDERRAAPRPGAVRVGRRVRRRNARASPRASPLNPRWMRRNPRRTPTTLTMSMPMRGGCRFYEGFMGSRRHTKTYARACGLVV